MQRTTPRLELDQIIDPMKDEAAAEALRHIQGNILVAHGRDHAVHLFFRITDATAARTCLADFTRQYVDSAWEQMDKRAAFRASLRDGGLFGAVYLSMTGYKALGIPEERMPTDPSFRKGMKNPDPEMHDAPADTWEPPYRGAVDGMLLLADDDRERLVREATRISEELRQGLETLTLEWGDVVRREGFVTEHFGFIDGISNPLFLRSDIERDVETRGGAYWKSAAPAGLVLVEDPSVDEAPGYGSYLVFRKLEQDVEGFKAAEHALAETLGLRGIERERAGAFAVGRFRDGTPLVTAQPPAQPSSQRANDFNFDLDPNATVCPFHAHIRKANPRGDLSRRESAPVLLEAERMFRIARRGISYDMSQAPRGQEPAQQGVGLLFMSFQFRLRNFEIQQGGFDAGDFVREGVGPDPIAGQSRDKTPQTWPSPTGPKQFRMANFVTLRGGEYFFAPSMTFLRSLA